MTFTHTKGIEVEEEERFRRKFSFKKLYHMPHSQMKETGFQWDHSENCNLMDLGRGCAGWLLTGQLTETDSKDSHLQSRNLLT